MAFHSTFANPFATLNTGTTAHVAPVYPFFYSLMLRVFGTGYLALWILWVSNVAFFALQMAMFPVLARRAGFGMFVGIISAVLGTISLFAPIDTRTESFLCGTLLMAAWIATISYANGRRDYGTVLTLGAVWGILILTNPVMVILLCAWSLCIILAHPRSNHVGFKNFSRRYATVGVVAMLVVSPWILRNYARFGAFIFVRDNLGLELYTSNNSCAMPTLEQNIQSGCHAQTHPNPTASVASEVAGRELQFNRARLRMALVWIESNRTVFVSLTARRLRSFWFPSLPSVRDTIIVWLITAGSLWGLWVLAGKDRLAASLIASTWLCFPLIYYVVQADPRYRYPIYWTSLLATGCGLADVARRMKVNNVLRIYTEGLHRKGPGGATACRRGSREA